MAFQASAFQNSAFQISESQSQESEKVFNASLTFSGNSLSVAFASGYELLSFADRPLSVTFV